MPNFKSLALFGVLLSSYGRVSARPQHEDLDENGDGNVDDMGPTAFMWPPDRVWFEFTDNVGPCGSPDGPGNRTRFPLTNGAVALVQQDESFDIQISISYSNDPQSDSDFEVLVASDQVRQLDPGHQCLNLADPPSSVTSGSNATIQAMFRSEFDTGVNETYYACADITYVPQSEFNYRIPCFNATSPEPKPTSSSASAPSSTGTTASSGDENSAATASSSSGLSGGAIAGIVIGAVVGVGVIGILLFFKYRKDQRGKRVAEHQTSPNAVKWDEDARSGAESNNSIQLQNLSK